MGKANPRNICAKGIEPEVARDVVSAQQAWLVHGDEVRLQPAVVGAVQLENANEEEEGVPELLGDLIEVGNGRTLVPNRL